MTAFDWPISRSRLRQDLIAAVEFCFWVVLLGPPAQVLLWVAVEGRSVSWETGAHRYVLILIHFLCYASFFGLGTVFTQCRGRRLNRWELGLGGAVLAVLASLCATGISFAMGTKNGTDWPAALLFSTCTGMGVTGLVLVIGRLYQSAVTSRLQAQRRELDRERAQRAAAEARWNSLESRIHPHFLFNTLSSIRELMHRDVSQADMMIQRFASLIRFSLDSSRNTLVPLAEELQTVVQYLEIEKMRLGSRLAYQMTVPPECSQLPVPALSVLTLVENSVKHAVACRRSGGRLEIAATIDGTRLRVEVSDDGAGFGESEILPEHGLDLLLRRLESLYAGNSAALVLPAADGPVRVTLVIPIQKNGQPANANIPVIAHHEQTSLLPR